jgi:acetyl-CoA carboxylase/biotin carboxylase 1
MGVPLSRIPEIRRLYGEEPNGRTPIDFDARLATPLPGHVIACRITAENPESGFQVRGAIALLEPIFLF